MMLACILMSQTHAISAGPVLAELLRRWPNPAALADATIAEVEDLVRPLGLWRKRAEQLVSLSSRWVEKPPRGPPAGYPGIGRYALDSWAIFVEGRADVDPDDPVLRAYMRRVAEDASPVLPLGREM